MTFKYKLYRALVTTAYYFIFFEGKNIIMHPDYMYQIELCYHDFKKQEEKQMQILRIQTWMSFTDDFMIWGKFSLKLRLQKKRKKIFVKSFDM